MRQFYAYVHARADGSVFYVGKGHGKRAWYMKGRNAHHQNVIGKHGINDVLIGKIDCSSEAIAFDLERGLIKCLLRMGVELTNCTDGGEGTTGYRHTDAAKERCRIAALGENNPFFGKKRPEHAARLLGRKRPDQSAWLVDYIAKNGALRGMLGKKHSDETIAKMRSHASEIASRSSALFKGVPKSEAQKKKMSASATGHVWMNKDGKRTHCSEDRVVELENLGWRRGQK